MYDLDLRLMKYRRSTELTSLEHACRNGNIRDWTSHTMMIQIQI